MHVKANLNTFATHWYEGLFIASDFVLAHKFSIFSVFKTGSYQQKNT
jgi:hypothetical protein